MDAIDRLRKQRHIRGIAALLLPHSSPHIVDWPAFERLLERTVNAGLEPAVNMDTGFVQLIDTETRDRVLRITASFGSRFVAGVFVPSCTGESFDLAAHVGEAERIQNAGGTPIIFPSPALSQLDEAGWIDALRTIGAESDRFLAFELGSMFVPYGRIYSVDAFRELLSIHSCVGMKHSSLDRQQEWARLLLRDALRPDFHIFTGNDHAIDMVMYGSDYLLGLASFAPDLFASRDRMWESGDPAFYQLNDALQYLGRFAFRAPTPAYRHNAAQFLKLRGWLSADAVPSGCPTRPDADVAVLHEIATSLGVLHAG